MNNKRLTTESFIERARKIHPDIYDYSNVKYLNNHTAIKIICNKGHDFYPRPNNFLFNKSRCPKCVRVDGLDTFIEKSNKIHGKIYDYSQAVYVDTYTSIDIICHKHGKFSQRPIDHIQKRGCQKCGNSITMSNKYFIEKSIIIHNNKYNYSLTNIIRGQKKINIICPKHGKFVQSIHHHLNGHGCPTCNNVISKSELAWLNHINIPEEFRHKTIIVNSKKFNLDAFDADKKIIYEFYGDFWHGNPEIFDPKLINYKNKRLYGDLYSKTIERENYLIGEGYKVVSIWEADFDRVLSKKVYSRIKN